MISGSPILRERCGASADELSQSFANRRARTTSYLPRRPGRGQNQDSELCNEPNVMLSPSFTYIVHSAHTSRTFGVTGNFGVQDLELALRWVKTHIAASGDDPVSSSPWPHESSELISADRTKWSFSDSRPVPL